MPYWRLSGFYFAYFAALGVFVPFWGLYLKGLGFDAVAIGMLLAIPMATKIVAPVLWGWLADYWGRRMAIVRAGALLTALVFCLVFWVSGFWPLALAMALFSFFWNAILPQFEAVTFNYLGRRVARYARVRLWGSIGFIVAVIGVGYGVDRWGAAVAPWMLLLCYLAVATASLLVAEPPAPRLTGGHTPILQVLRYPTVLAFFAVCLFHQAGHAAYYGFYSIYLEEQGYSKALTGQLWALGVVAEVLVFLVMHRLLQGQGARRVLIASLLLTALRWFLIGQFPHWLPLLVAAQFLHAASFGAFHAAAIHLVHHYFTGRHQGRGQALYGGVSFGAGGAIGSVLSGVLWSNWGAAFTFHLAAAASLLAAAITWRWVKEALPGAVGGMANKQTG